VPEKIDFGPYGELREVDVLRAIRYDAEAHEMTLQGLRPGWRKINETSVEWMVASANSILEAVQRAEEIVKSLPAFERKAELVGLLWRIRLEARYIAWKSKVTLDVNASLWPLP
jgi:hypothetical protein